MPPKYLVLGAGMMGRAAAYDLAQMDPASSVVVADVDPAAAEKAARAAGPNARPLTLDAGCTQRLACRLPWMLARASEGRR